MRIVVRIVLSAGIGLSLSACQYLPFTNKERPIVEPRGPVTAVEQRPEQAPADEPAARIEQRAQQSLQAIADIAAAIANGDTKKAAAVSGDDGFIEAVRELLAAREPRQIDIAIRQLEAALDKTKKGTPRHNIGSILLSEANDRRQLAASSDAKVSEISRLKRETFSLRQKLAEAEKKLRDLATIEEQLTRTRPATTVEPQ